jgi:hypothetical protein
MWRNQCISVKYLCIKNIIAATYFGLYKATLSCTGLCKEKMYKYACHIIKNWNIILSQVFVVTQVLYLVVTLHWRGAVLLVISYKKVEMWVMMACHFHSGIGNCEPHRLKYIEVIQQLFHKNPNPFEIKSREGLVFIMCSYCAYS